MEWLSINADIGWNNGTQLKDRAAVATKMQVQVLPFQRGKVQQPFPKVLPQRENATTSNNRRFRSTMGGSAPPCGLFLITHHVVRGCACMSLRANIIGILCGLKCSQGDNAMSFYCKRIKSISKRKCVKCDGCKYFQKVSWIKGFIRWMCTC